MKLESYINAKFVSNASLPLGKGGVFNSWENNDDNDGDIEVSPGFSLVKSA